MVKCNLIDFMFFDKCDDDDVGSGMESNFSGDKHLFVQGINLVEDNVTDSLVWEGAF